MNKIITTSLLLLPVCLLGVVPVAFAATSYVSNNVSVSASGDGVSSVEVKSVVNGETVEEYSYEGSGAVSYSSNSVVDEDGVSTTSGTQSVAAEADSDNSEAVAEQYHTLLRLYEQLMSLIRALGL